MADAQRVEAVEDGGEQSPPSPSALDELNEAMGQAAPERTIAEEWTATAAAVNGSSSRWLKIVFVELPHLIRAVLGFPKAVVSSMVRLSLIALRLFIRFKSPGSPEAPPSNQGNNDAEQGRMI